MEHSTPNTNGTMVPLTQAPSIPYYAPHSWRPLSTMHEIIHKAKLLRPW